MGARRLIGRALGRAAERLLSGGLHKHGLRISDLAGVDAGGQLLLAQSYRRLARAGEALPSIGEVGFRCYSQSDDDGILLFLTAVVGEGQRTAVEIGAGDGVLGNTANLAVHHGWSSLMLEADTAKVERGRDFFARHPDTCIHPPTLIQCWVDVENVNGILSAHGFQDNLALLSLDIDGMDYWVWKALKARPAVVVLEYNSAWGPDASVTVPYLKDFRCSQEQPHYYGASLAALTGLSNQKGYRLVGANRHQFNAFFVAEEHAGPFVEISPSDCFSHPFAQKRIAEGQPQIKDLPWEQV